jgi:hypothetical protein
MSDVFVSYTNADEAWAEWIAWVLEDAGLAAVFQKWDFRPGGNFVLEMQRAAAAAERTIAVLSPDYLQSAYAAPEWAAAFARDPRGLQRIMVPSWFGPAVLTVSSLNSSILTLRVWTRQKPARLCWRV